MVLYLINKINFKNLFYFINHKVLDHVLKINYNEYDSMVLLLIVHNNMNQLMLMESFKKLIKIY